MISAPVVFKKLISSDKQEYFSKIDKKDFFIYEEEYEKNTTLMYRPPEMADLY